MLAGLGGLTRAGDGADRFKVEDVRLDRTRMSARWLVAAGVAADPVSRLPIANSASPRNQCFEDASPVALGERLAQRGKIAFGSGLMAAVLCESDCRMNSTTLKSFISHGSDNVLRDGRYYSGDRSLLRASAE